jgi:protein-S-isoprenylcysteine O-methyltransferase Ste14
MKPWAKWLIAIPFIAVYSLGLSWLVAGRLWWFVGDWAETVFVLAVVGMWLGGTAFYQPGRGQRGASLTRGLISIGLILLVPVAVYDRTHGPAASSPAFWTWLGLALCAGAAPVGILAWRTLGRFYVPDPEVLPEQRLITDGIYRHLRHPMYTAALLWVVGFPLVIRSGWGTLVGILFIGPAIWLRIREEEAMLLEAFGDEYRRYQACTWRLVPLLF